MRRERANAIRFLMDECVPPIIRDSRWFMRPFFMLAYGTSDVDRFMGFKDRVWTMSAADYAEFYQDLGNSVSRRRVTDLNNASVRWIMDSVPDGRVSVLDVGCGNGHLLRELHRHHPDAELAGVDVAPSPPGPLGPAQYAQALLPDLPFSDRSFDFVCCTHVLEHVLDLPAACRELQRVCSQELLIVVPRQREFHYTLDEHVNFFWHAEHLAQHFRPMRMRLALLGGDWALRVRLGGRVGPASARG